MRKQDELLLCRLFKDGWKTTAIEAKFGISRSVRKRVLKEYNIPPRKAGPQLAGYCMLNTDKQLELCRLFQEGITNKLIEAKFGISSCTRRVILRKHNIPPRKDGRPRCTQMKKSKSSDTL